MRYLLDVNVLIALAIADHDLHDRTIAWMKPRRRGQKLKVGTCAITELAFIRILCQPVYGYTIGEAKRMLARLTMIPDLDFLFLEDDVKGGDLPDWVAGASQVTDGHLLRLARRHEASLATLDQGIPGGFLIPQRA